MEELCGRLIGLMSLLYAIYIIFDFNYSEKSIDDKDTFIFTLKKMYLKRTIVITMSKEFKTYQMVLLAFFIVLSSMV